MTDHLTCVGAIAGAFGVRGEMRIKSFCADPADIKKYSPFVSEDGKTTFKMTISRPLKGGFAGRMDSVTNKEDADALKGTRLCVPLSRLPTLPDDEFYHSDLVGLPVFDTGGVERGQIRAVHDHGAGDILEIFGPGLTTTVLLPFTKENVPTVDLGAGRIVIDPPDGTFPE